MLLLLNGWNRKLLLLLRRLRHLFVIAERIVDVFWCVPFEQLHDDFVSHAVVPDETLPGIFGHVAASLYGAQIRRLRWHSFRQRLFVMAVAQMLVKGVSRRKHQFAKRTFDLQG